MLVVRPKGIAFECLSPSLPYLGRLGHGCELSLGYLGKLIDIGIIVGLAVESGAKSVCLP